MVRVAFIHPDLGIGGAERLVVDAGLALKSRGHEVHFFTSHHDKSHCFEETRNGSLNVTSVGDWLPRHFFGCFYAFWAYLRMIYVAIYLIFFSSWRMDVIICDQVSVCIPVLKLSKARVVFYCHFPDMLLTQRKSFLKKLYRAPLDWLEEVTTGMFLEFMCMHAGRGGGGGSSSYSPGNTPYKIQMGVIVAVVLFGNLQRIWSQKKIGIILMLLNSLTFGTSTISFVKGRSPPTSG